MTKKAAIFDVDGTLVDSNDAHARAWVRAFASENVTIAFPLIRRAIGMGGDKLLPAVANIDPESPLGQRLRERRSREFIEHELAGIKAFPAVRALAERLAADGYVLVIASSAQAGELQPLLQRAAIDDLIAEQSSADDAEQSKPDPDIVEAACKKAGVAPADAIMLGDTPYDVEAARRAGVRVVGVRCGGWPDADLRGAAAVYADPADLLSNYDTSPFAVR